jgi:hypothetical protein
LSSQITEDLVKLFDGLVRKTLEEDGYTGVQLPSGWVRRKASRSERHLRQYRSDLERYTQFAKDDGGLELQPGLAEAVTEAIQDYADYLRLRGEFETPRAPKAKSSEATRVHSAEAHRSITRINTHRLVCELRQEFFKQDSAPMLYPFGHEWVKANSVEPGRETDQVTFTAKLEGATSDKVFATLKDALSQPGQQVAASLRTLADALEDEPVRLHVLESVKLEISPEMGKAPERRYVADSVFGGPRYGGEEIKVTGLWLHFPHVLPVWAVSGPALDLWHKAKGVSDASEGYWSQQQALDYILTGYENIDGITIEKFWRGAPGRPHPARFAITVNAPTTPEDLAKFYAEELERQGLRAVAISKTHQKLLELEAVTPKMYWPARADLWVEWCRQDSELEPFGEPKYKILRTQAERAKKERADWQPTPEEKIRMSQDAIRQEKQLEHYREFFKGKKIATTVPPLKPNKPKSKPVKS